MDRIQHASAAASAPTYPALSGTVGYFIDDSTTPSGATVATPRWFNAVQEEIRNVITAGGLTPSQTTLNQMSQAMIALVTGAAPSVPAGIVEWTAATSASLSGYLPCDGAAVSRSTYASLFTAIGTTYGVGNGSTTFNVPPLSGRTAIGVGTGSGLTTRALGAAVGTETHVLSEAEMPSHSHSVVAPTNVVVDERGTLSSVWSILASSLSITNATGGGGAHNNMQPSLVLRPFIKT